VSWHALLVAGVSLLVILEMAKFWQLPWPPTSDEVLAQWWVTRELVAGFLLLAGGLAFLAYDLYRVVGGVGAARENLWADLAILGAFLAIVLHKLRTAKVFLTTRGVWFADRQFHAWERFHPMEIEAGVLRERAFFGLKAVLPPELRSRVQGLYRRRMEELELEARARAFEPHLSSVE
jgi:hypothetical protein